MPVPQVADIRTCGEASGLFQRLAEKASTDPGLAFACAPLLKTEEQRDVIRRQAFAAALLHDPATARLYLNGVASRPWISEAGFLPALRLARETNSQALWMAAARMNPSLALREVPQYIGLPFGQEAFDEAAAMAPDEAAGLAGGNTGAEILHALAASPRLEIQTIAVIARDTTLSPFQRERVAAFFRQISSRKLTIAAATQFIGDDNFFRAIAREPAFNESILERTAQTLLRTYRDQTPNLEKFSANELYLLLAYGRSEEDDDSFNAIFERFLLPKLRRERFASAGKPRFLSFLAAAAAHGKLDAFTAASADPELLGRTMRGLESIQDALEAAEVVDAISSPEQLKLLRTEIESTPRDSPIYGLLAVRLATRLNVGNWPRANEYARYFRETKQLGAASVFDARSQCIQRYFFYNDDDGVESFKSFLSGYETDPAWKIESAASYVHLTGKGVNSRRIEIYANLPAQDGQPEISKLLAALGLEPSVFVHRGHAFHVEQSLRYLTPASKLVYLGSCRGMDASVAAISRSTDAQVIVTRGVGTLSVNDPVLKALNSELLSGVAAINWNAFWKRLEQRFEGSALFHDYVPPNRNLAAAMMGAYYFYLSSQ